MVLALGNPIRSDDGVGLAALRRLETDPRVPGSITLVDGGTKGLELVSYVSGTSHLLILDAVDVSAEAGTVIRIEGDELRSLPGTGSVHELALADILNALRMLGEEPQQTVFLGMQPRTTELGTCLSECVEGAVPSLVEAAVAQLLEWSYHEPYRQRGELNNPEMEKGGIRTRDRQGSLPSSVSGVFDVPSNSR